jgi:uncharacterized protein YndB with AHSA1/START domain
MDARIDPVIPAELRQVVITRTFDAPRKLVWQAWTDPQHVKAWWGPHGFDAVNPTVDLRVGGAMNFDMRAPDGTILPGVGVIRELDPPRKLVVSNSALPDESGEPTIEILTTVTLAEDKERTKLTLRATVVHAKGSALDALKGMKQGWSESLAKMSEHLDLVRWGAGDGGDDTSFVVPKGDPVVVVRRTFDAPRASSGRRLPIRRCGRSGGVRRATPSRCASSTSAPAASGGSSTLARTAAPSRSRENSATCGNRVAWSTPSASRTTSRRSKPPR